MPDITVVDSQGKTSTLQYTAPANLMELLKEAGYEEIAALCGGSCSCATCHLWLDEPQSACAQFPAKESNEAELLELADDFNEQKSRLSCQLTLTEAHAGLTVRLLAAGF